MAEATKDRYKLTTASKVLLCLAAAFLFIITSPFTVGPVLAALTHKISLVAAGADDYPIALWSLAGGSAFLLIATVVKLFEYFDDGVTSLKTMICLASISILALAVNVVTMLIAPLKVVLVTALVAAGGAPDWLVAVAANTLLILSILPVLLVVTGGVIGLLCLLGRFFDTLFYG